MARALNPLDPSSAWQRGELRASKLYGAIVAQARLPAFYRDFGLPDTLEGRFASLSLHLFTVLDRLKAEGDEARNLAQALSDRFSEDMEIVLREIGVSDLRIPKKMRGLAASSASMLQSYETASTGEEGAFANTIAESLPMEGEAAKQTAAQLAPCLREVMRRLRARSMREIETGKLRFPEPSA
jgi:cytochrome b pre-mRNA-processing protein 3